MDNIVCFHNAFKSKEVYEWKERPDMKCIKSDIKNQDVL